MVASDCNSIIDLSNRFRDISKSENLQLGFAPFSFGINSDIFDYFIRINSFPEIDSWLSTL
jgi:hypothetical protein